MNRPKFQRKGDVLIRGQSSKEDQAVDHAIAPFDRVAREMDRKWGTDVLPTLVTPALAAKYGKTLGSLNVAIAASDAERAADRATACIRGMMAMDAEAVSMGRPQAPAGVILVEGEGYRFGILIDDRYWQVATEENLNMRIYTLGEIAVLVHASEDQHPLIETAKQIPGATIVAVRKEQTLLSRDLDDEIPF